MCQEFGYKNYSEFLREAIDFYADWKMRGTTEKVITPEIESIVGAVTRKCSPTMPFGEWIDFWYQTYCKNTLKEST